jgi:dTMP kinase
LEGPDRSGKSTQARRLAGALRRAGRRVVHTREPGGTAFAEAIRSLLLDPRQRVHPLAELLLYEAARAQHTGEVIRPALRRGDVVVSERYTMATLAYQGVARGLPLPLIRRLNRVATGGLEPDLTLVLDMPDREFSRRGAGRGRDRLEAEGARFRAKVRSGYLRLARTERRTALLRAVDGPDAMSRCVLGSVARRLPELGLAR